MGFYGPLLVHFPINLGNKGNKGNKKTGKNEESAKLEKYCVKY